MFTILTKIDRADEKLESNGAILVPQENQLERQMREPEYPSSHHLSLRMVKERCLWYQNERDPRGDELVGHH